MGDPETLRALLARVEGAAGADEAMDDDLWAAFGNPNTGSLYDYTASVDAALALVGRVMLERMWTIGSVETGGYAASVEGPLKREASTPYGVGEFYREPMWCDHAPTPALALLAALLRAKIAETEHG